jgi:hypothetical protein
VSLYDVHTIVQDQPIEDDFQELYEQLSDDFSSVTETWTPMSSEEDLFIDETIRIKLLQDIVHGHTGDDGDMLALQDAQQALRLSLISKKDIA